jgi:dienelactone hydrolase
MGLGRFLARCIAFACLAAAAPLAAQVTPPPLEAYGELPAIEGVALSPQGTRIAVLLTVGRERMLAVFDEAMNPLQRFDAADLKVREFSFVDEDRLLLFTSSTETLPPEYVSSKLELYQALILSLSNPQEPQLVFGNRPAIMDSIFGDYGVRMVEGRPVGYFLGYQLMQGVAGKGYRYEGGHYALFAVDLIDNSTRRVDYYVEGHSSRSWLIGSDGDWPARFELESDKGKWTIRNKAGVQLATGVTPNGDAGLLVEGKDGTTIIYYVDDAEAGAIRYYEVPTDGSGSPVEIFAEGIDRIYSDRTTGRLLGYLPEGSDDPVFYDSTKQRAVRAVLLAFDELHARVSDWSTDFTKILVNTSGSGDSGSYYAVDMVRANAKLVGHERPAIRSSAVGPISTIEYAAGDDLQIEAILTLPPGREPSGLPLVVLPHGGPHAHDDDHFDWWAQAFASRGYAVLQPNFRGSTNRGDEFMRAGYGEWGRKMQSDLSDGIAHLAGAGTIDPKRVCIVGASYGGYAALVGVTLQQGIYRCAVAVAPVTDLELQLRFERMISSRNRMIRVSLDEEFGKERDFDAISPRQNARRASAPILLIHGRDDTVVEFRQSTGMADALKDAGKPHRLIELEGEDHWLSKSETRHRMVAESLAFVTEHNPPD